MAMFDKFQDICDVVSILLHCVEDNSFFVVQDNTQELWIPSSKVDPKRAWRDVAKQLMTELKAPGTPQRLSEVVRVWKPFSQTHVHHVVFLALVARAAKQACQPPADRRCFWATPNELVGNYAKLRSPELLNFLSAAKGVPLQRPAAAPNPATKIGAQPSWVSIVDEDPLSQVQDLPESSVLSQDATHRKIMEWAGFAESTQSAIFACFLVSCFPATLMNARVFCNVFVDKFGWDRAALPRLFYVADLDARGFLSYRDFVYVVAVTDPNMKHGVSEIRSRYIFKYYDADADRQVGQNDLRAMQSDLKTVKTKSADSMALTREMDALAKALGVEARAALDVERFVKAVAAPRARGTSVLLRSTRTASVALPASSLQDAPAAPAPATASLERALTPPMPLRRAGGQDYAVAVNCIKLKKNGTLIDKIWNVDGAMSAASLASSKQALGHSASMESFNQNNVHFEVLRGLEYFEKEVTPREAAQKPGKKAKAAYNWGQVEPTGFARCLKRVSEQVVPLLRAEPRLLELKAPVYVLGDMHGSFADMMRFEKALWPLGPTLSPTTLLVLGDFVDRGPHSVELIAYLFAYKLQSPHKMMLLRGNHEIRAVQRMFTFLKECCHKFGEKLGSEVWEAVNTAMDCLPLAALIDGKVFCAHGGIPPPWLCPSLAAINTVPCPLPRPDEQSPLAWELMWNDPLAAAEVTATLQMEMNANEGFAVNTRRGTGHWFSQEALQTFLRTNGLSLVLRAHQTADVGFYVQMQNRMETVFSASKYGKADNEAACVLVDSGRLRAFRVDMAS